MKSPDFPIDEDERVGALHRLNILDTDPEEGFDRITRIARSYFDVPIALVSLVDSDRQWFKSKQGLDAPETPRDISFCGHAILGTDIFYIPNTLEDERFADNPLVTGPPNIRFYAGAPISSSDGKKIGTLCVIGSAPKTLTDENLSVLSDLADCIEQELGQAQLLNTTQVLAFQQSRFRAVLDTVVDGIITIDAKGNIETFNPAAEYLFGYSKKEVIGRNVKCLMPEPYYSEHDGYLKNFHDSGQAKIIGIGREVVGKRKDGSTFPMELAVDAMDVGGVKMFTGIVRDISERHQAEQSLRDREQQMSAILQNVVDGIVTIDQKGMIKTFNPAAERLFGYVESDVVGQNVKCLMPEPYHGEHDGYLKNFHDSGQAKIIGIGREVVGKRKDGSTFPMELAVGEMSVGGAQMFTGIVRDITERKQSEMMKNEFVSTVSHELRTPLTSIMGSLGLIKSGAVGLLPENLGRMLDIAYNNSDRLVHLINDILDIEKIEAGKMDFQMAPLDLRSLLEQSIDANKGYGEEHNVSFELSSMISEAMVEGDKNRMMQVMTNLMSNAAKFSPAGGSVLLSLAEQNGDFRVSVTDRGSGIPEAFKKKIFGKFHQADSSNTRQKGGTGLGLNITKAIVEQHGGHINFESVVDRETTFFFDLPRLHKHKASIVTTMPDYAQNILICEDDYDIAMLLEMMLKQNGYSADIAHNAAEAEGLLDKNFYDAMTLDIGLPDKDGITLLRELRAKERTKNLPIIIISALVNDRSKALYGDAVGVIDWLEKPIDQERFTTALRQTLAGSSNDKARILHVEDDMDILQIVASVVGDLADVVPAMSLSEAKAILVEQSFDLVVLDLSLPDGSGEEILGLLKKGKNKSIPVIVFSGQEISNKTTQNIRAALVKSKTSNEALLDTIRSSIEARNLMK